MADLPPERLMVNTRPYLSLSSVKMWPLMFACMMTGAVEVELPVAYNVDFFLTAFHTFCSRRRFPQFDHTDKRSQMVKAGEIAMEGVKGGFDWDKVVNARGSQCYNGVSERGLRAFKETFAIILPQGAHRLNYVKFYAFLVRCASLINDRPLGVKRVRNDHDTLLLITPNLLMLSYLF